MHGGGQERGGGHGEALLEQGQVGGAGLGKTHACLTYGITFFLFFKKNHTVPTTAHDYTLKKLPREKMGNTQKNTM